MSDMEENNDKKRGNEEKVADGTTPVTSDDGWAKAGKWVKNYGAISGVLILVISGFAYLCAYFYELGFCQQFGIPSDLIDISWIRFLIATIKLLFMAMAFCISFLTIGFFTKDFTGKYKKLKSFLLAVVSLILMMSLLVFFFWVTQTYISDVDQYYSWGFLLVIVLVLLLIRNRRISQEQSESKPLQKGVVLMLFLFGLFIIPAAYSMRGSDDASHDKEYSVLSSNQSIAVLRVYGDNAICAPWYKEGNQSYITKEFVILTLENITLIPQEIGPLHVKSAE